VPVGPPPGYAPAPKPAFDANHPLAAAAGYRAAPSVAPVAQLQRIEVDELGVQQAAKSARKQGLVIGIVIAGVLGGVGYVAGGAAEQGAGRTKSKGDAKELSASVAKASTSLKALAEKMEAGSNALLKERKFPDTLSKDLGAINVDFDGTQLAGRRFSGFPQDTTHELVSFITSVEGVNDRKAVIQRLLDRLQKPITEQLAIPAGTTKVSYVVAVDKDPSGNLAGFLSTLAAPIQVTPQNISLPAKFTFANPGGSGNTELPRYSGGDIARSPAAIYVVPKTFETACPSAQNGQIAQLGAQIGDFIRTIKGEGAAPAGTDSVQDSKPGLVERADKLADALNKI
jgi:outer membrane murein-binding lipoprotein Lpp